VSFSRRLAQLAADEPDRIAVVCGDRSLTIGELVRRADDLAVELRDLGVQHDDMVTVALPNSVDWFVAFAAIWRAGATPQPISARLPQREIDALVELADPRVIIGVPDGSVPDRATLPVGHVAPDAGQRRDALPDDVATSWKAPTSGGSTGRPKLIVSGDPAMIDVDQPLVIAKGTPGVLVMPGPLYHNGPLIWSLMTLLYGGTVVVLPRFDAEDVLRLIDRHRATQVYLVPTMMKRIWRLPEETRGAYDLSSLVEVWHLAEPCPEWLKQVWIDWLGPERIYELYGGTEGQTATTITGVEWLAHRGSVGRPAPGTVCITDFDGVELPPNEMGEVWLRNLRDTPTYRYVGAVPRTREGGWESLGDMGYLDEGGYLHLGDRANDMILSGGANIYPAEVEAALQEHPLIESCVVIGLPDDDRGNVVHAIIEGDPAAIDEAELRVFLAERLVSYKVPRVFEFVDEPLRDDAGKVRRAALRQERMPT
ncbi:MAG: AMP-binding protein, partial [Ilumatobacteraceae bacterium]